MPHPRRRLVADREQDAKIIAPAIGLALLQLVVSAIVVCAFVFTVLLRTDAGVAPQALMLWTMIGAWILTLGGLVVGYELRRSPAWVPVLSSALIVVAYVGAVAMADAG